MEQETFRIKNFGRFCSGSLFVICEIALVGASVVVPITLVMMIQISIFVQQFNVVKENVYSPCWRSVLF